MKTNAEFEAFMREMKTRSNKSEIKRHEETIEEIARNWNSNYNCEFPNTSTGRKSKAMRKAYAEKRIRELRVE